MKLFLCILCASLLSVLVFFGPFGMYLLSVVMITIILRACMAVYAIHKQVMPAVKKDKVEQAYENYLTEQHKAMKK